MQRMKHQIFRRRGEVLRPKQSEKKRGLFQTLREKRGACLRESGARLRGRKKKGEYGGGEDSIGCFKRTGIEPFPADRMHRKGNGIKGGGEWSLLDGGPRAIKQRMRPLSTDTQ